ncbi:MAG: hypothetical protein ACREPM_20565, partial [Gemmatimonadaceae bacterium]
TSQDLRQHHAALWGRMAATLRVAAPVQTGALGQFIWSRVDVPRPNRQTETLILYSAKSGSTYMAIGVDATRADLVARDLPAFEAMVRTASLADAAAVASAPAASASPAGGPAPPAGNPATLGDYVYTMPPGWTAQQYPDGLVLMSPASVTNERCVFTLWPMRGAGNNLVSDANAIFQDIYKAYRPANQTVRGSPMEPTIARGTSGQGWDYVIVRRGVAPPGSPESRLAFAFVAKLDGRLAVISGVSRDPLISTCMGELIGNVWPRFFYSVSFKSWTPVDDQSALQKQLVGVWTAATATAADQFTFAPNGRYGGAAAAQQYARVSSAEVLTTTQAYFGNGAYTLRGNAITLTADDQKNTPESAFFRVEEESKDDGRTWVPYLYLLRVSRVDGKDYELRYHKQ